MGAYIEVWGGGPPELFPLEGDTTTVGRARSNGISVVDPTVSELHAVIEAYGASFAVRDVGSANGTYVNGEQVLTERRLRAGDEVRSARPGWCSASNRMPPTPFRPPRPPNRRPS